jgi:eukaryotic-like serine/threonine-protein kinase
MAPPTEDSTIFRSFGTCGVWFPRGLLLRQAAEQAFIGLLREWQGTGDPTALVEVEAACARALADPDLRFEALCNRIQTGASSVSGNQLEGGLTALLAHLEEQSQLSVAQDDPGNWARQALAQVQQTIGTATPQAQDSDWRRSKLSRALSVSTHKLAEEWDDRLAAVAYGLMEHPGRRIAAAEAGMARFLQCCDDALATNQVHLTQQAARTGQAGQQLQTAMAACAGFSGGFSLFGGRSRRLLRVFMDHLAAFCRQRLAEELVAAGLMFFGALRSRLNDRMQELSFCRQRMRHLQETLEAGPEANEERLSDTPPSYIPAAAEDWMTVRESPTIRLVLPEGEKDLRVAAAQFIERLVPDQWLQLDQALQDRVLTTAGGLHKVCLTNGDLTHGLAAHLVPQIAICLGELLPVTDVAEVEYSAVAAQHTEVGGLVDTYFSSAAPRLAGKETDGQMSFLLVPASDAGKRFGDEAQRVFPMLELIRVPGQDDLTFCREQGNLGIHSLQREFQPCRRAYEEAATVPPLSPHSRFDIVDWVPLDP